MTQKSQGKSIVGQQTMEKIRNLIASGRYQPGDKIPTEKQLAEKFDIGRSSIREAIKVFNYLGILESHTARGTFVCQRSNITTEALSWTILLGNDDFYSLIEFRGSLELWCFMRLAREHAEDPIVHNGLLVRLNDVIRSMEEAEKKGQTETLVYLDYDFHKLILQEVGNKIMVSVYETLKSFLHEEIKKAHLAVDELPQLAERHHSLLKSIKSGDPVIAAEAIQKHLEQTNSFVRITLAREQKKR